MDSELGGPSARSSTGVFSVVPRPTAACQWRESLDREPEAPTMYAALPALGMSDLGYNPNQWQPTQVMLYVATARI